MSFMDSIKEKFGNMGKSQDQARDQAKRHKDTIDKGIDRAGRTADDKTGGRYGDQVKGGTDKAKDAMDRYTDDEGR